MRHRDVSCRLAPAWVLGLGLGLAGVARGQAPTLPEPTVPNMGAPGSTRSSLGPSPGEGAIPFGASPGAGENVLGGRAGPSVPRVPSSATTPGGGMQALPAPAIAPLQILRAQEPPLYGPLDAPLGAPPEGPAGGLTLDQAIDRLVTQNLDLRSRFFEIPQADADILTASLRANPLLYADAQLVPYGQYSNTRPGGPLQYDLNITHPFDLSHKRQMRTLVAHRAKHVLEAQYQDAVRIEINNLYTAWVDYLSAQQTVWFRQKSLQGYADLLRVTRRLYERSDKYRADLVRMELLYNTTAMLYQQDQEALQRGRRVLGTLLFFTPVEAENLQIHGSIADVAPLPPASDELVRLALQMRPDLNAQRLGISRAEADVRLALANRFQDVYLLYQPYTFQNNAPFGSKSSTSWAAGITVPLPVYNRNQGNIQRARLNVTQTQVELAALERKVINEVLQAERNYAFSRAMAQKYERDLLPSARKVVEDSKALYVGGEFDVIGYLNAISNYLEIVRQYRDIVVSHRRYMLYLNTAVGQRILP